MALIALATIGASCINADKSFDKTKIEFSPDPISEQIVDVPFSISFQPRLNGDVVNRSTKGAYIVRFTSQLEAVNAGTPTYSGPGFAQFHGGDTKGPYTYMSMIDGEGARAFEVTVDDKTVEVVCKSPPGGIVDAHFTDSEGECTYPDSGTPYPDEYYSQLGVTVDSNGHVILTQPETGDINSGDLNSEGTEVTLTSPNGNERYEFDVDPDSEKWTGFNFYTNTDDCVMKYAVEFDLSTAVSDKSPTPAPQAPSNGQPSEVNLQLEPGLAVHLEGSEEGDMGTIRATVDGPEGTEVRLGVIGTGGLGDLVGTIDGSGTAELSIEVKAGRYRIAGTVGDYDVDEKLTFP